MGENHQGTYGRHVPGRVRLRRWLIGVAVIAVIAAGGWGVNQWYVHTHCTLWYGREVCGANRYMPTGPDF